MRRWAAMVAAIVYAGALITSVAWVSRLENDETEVASTGTLSDGRAQPLASSARLIATELRAEQVVAFELCAEDRMEDEVWVDAFQLAIWRPQNGELMLRMALNAAQLQQVQRGPSGACWVFGRGRVQHTDQYAVDALFDELPTAIADVPLTVRVIGRPSRSSSDGVIILVALVASWLMIAAIAFATWRSPARDASAPAGTESIERGESFEVDGRAAHRTPWVRVAGGLLAVLLAFVVSGLLHGGRALSLLISVGLGAVEVGVAFALTGVRTFGGPSRAERLALHPPVAPKWKRWAAWGIAVLVGVAMSTTAPLLLRLVPSTGESPIQLYVSRPSGLISFAAIAVLLPLAEEVFFRGFVYGTIAQRNRLVAFGLSVLTFAIAHGYQTFGQWGALLAILLTGIALTGLRAWSGSTLVSATAHLSYNAMLALPPVLFFSPNS